MIYSSTFFFKKNGDPYLHKHLSNCPQTPSGGRGGGGGSGSGSGSDPSDAGAAQLSGGGDGGGGGGGSGGDDDAGRVCGEVDGGGSAERGSGRRGWWARPRPVRPSLGLLQPPCKRGGTRGRPGRVAAWVCAHPCATFSSKKLPPAHFSATEGRDRDSAGAAAAGARAAAAAASASRRAARASPQRRRGSYWGDN